MRCKNCGADVDSQLKFCEYCKTEINPNGKKSIIPRAEECFVVGDIFYIINRAIITGQAVKSFKVGDSVYFNEKQYRVQSIEKNRTVLSSVNSGDFCGILLKGFSKGDFQKGDRLHLFN